MPDVIVNVVHPSPLRFQPAGARKAKDVMVRLTTPVRLGSASRSEFHDAGIIKDDHHYAIYSFVEHRGAIWRVMPGGTEDRSVALAPSAFQAWLAGDHGALVEHRHLCRAQGRTPLQDGSGLSQDWYAWGDPEQVLAKARGIEMPKARHVEWDDADRSRRALVDYFENDVRTDGHRVYVRERPLCLAAGQVRPGKVSLATWLLSSRAEHALLFNSVTSLPVRPDLLGDAITYWFGEGADADKKQAPYLKVFGPGPLEDSDVAYLANWLPEMALRFVSSLAPPENRDACAEAAETLRKHGVRGRIGGVLPDEYETVMILAKDALELFANGADEKSTNATQARRASAYLEDRILPRLRSSLLLESETDELASLRV